MRRVLHTAFFFHPAVWFVNAQIGPLRVDVCDERAPSPSEAPRADSDGGYLMAILQANALPAFLPAALGMIHYKTMMRIRLTRILDGDRPLHIQSRPALQKPSFPSDRII